MSPKTQKTPDLVTFTEEIRNRKLRFLYSVSKNKKIFGKFMENPAKIE